MHNDPRAQQSNLGLILGSPVITGLAFGGLLFLLLAMGLLSLVGNGR